MMREAVSMKSKIMPRLNSLLKRGKLTSKAIGKVLQLRYSNLTCRSEELYPSFVSPGDYEFSCSNSPAYPSSYHISKPRNRGNKHVLRLNSLLKRGKLASTAIGKVLQLRYSNLTCRSEEVYPSFVSPGDYEFSCSNSPAYPSLYHISKPRNRGNKHVLHLKYNFVNGFMGQASPLQTLPGFGHSPELRQLRVTDSPFWVKDMGEDHDQVDKYAEEFIKRFYKDLENQS